MFDARRIINALSTKINIPRVTMVMGKVRMINSGFITEFNNARTIARTIAITGSSTDT
jgi:hypothetical protein